jgi:hypothetical protein
MPGQGLQLATSTPCPTEMPASHFGNLQRACCLIPGSHHCCMRGRQGRGVTEGTCVFFLKKISVSIWCCRFSAASVGPVSVTMGNAAFQLPRSGSGFYKTNQLSHTVGRRSWLVNPAVATVHILLGSCTAASSYACFPPGPTCTSDRGEPRLELSS